MADHLGLDRFIYVGHSMGGVVGMELGIRYAGPLESWSSSRRRPPMAWT